MITMKRVNKYHILVLDTKTDKSHLVAIEDESKTPILKKIKEHKEKNADEYHKK